MSQDRSVFKSGEIHIPVTKGPGKWSLVTQFVDGGIQTFTVLAYGIREITFQCHITSMEREDGSGESWNLGLRFVGKDNPVGFIGIPRMYYTTRGNKGTLIFD